MERMGTGPRGSARQNSRNSPLRPLPRDPPLRRPLGTIFSQGERAARAGMRRWECRSREPRLPFLGCLPPGAPRPPPHSPGEGGPAGPGASEPVPSRERGVRAARVPGLARGQPPPGLPFMARVRACDRGRETGGDGEPGRGRETRARDTEARDSETCRRDPEPRGRVSIGERGSETVMGSDKAIRTEDRKGRRQQSTAMGRVSDNQEMERGRGREEGSVEVRRRKERRGVQF